ncbi:MAG: HD domain-containing protein [Planctomycetota bacterium]
MSATKTRRQIANLAARLMYSRQESEYFNAKRKAARMLGLRRPKPSDLPSNAEIRVEVGTLTRIFEVADDGNLRAMRMHALWWMRKLRGFHPKLLGSVLTGNIRSGSDIDLHLFTNHPLAVQTRVEELGFQSQLQRKRIKKEGEMRVFNHVHIQAEFPVELTIYGLKDLGFRFRSSIDGKPIPRMSAEQFERFVAIEHDETSDSIDRQLAEMQAACDRFVLFQALLLPLESVVGSPEFHPEGDTLFHSLQVFDWARRMHAYDEEFLLAALLHDVGKAIDPDDHVGAGVNALGGFVTDRTRWLIEHHMLAHRYRDHTLGVRAKRRLRDHPWFDDLMDLQHCDRNGRQPGAAAPSLEEAIDYIESLSERFD